MSKKIKIIADACANHRGDIEVAKEMIWQAKECGADFIKFQSWLAEDNQRGQAEEMKPFELSDEAHFMLLEETKKAGIQFLTTCFNRKRVGFLATLGLPSIKVGSAECSNYDLLKALSDYFPHLIVSTGLHYDKEIEKAARVLKEKNANFTFLHCISMYPIEDDQYNLLRMNWLKTFTSSVGFSDHSRGDDLRASRVAIALGAEYIERHFILDRNLKTKDQPVSVDPKGLRELVEAARHPEEQKIFLEKFPQFLGKEHREMTEKEKENRRFYIGRWGK